MHFDAPHPGAAAPDRAPGAWDPDVADWRDEDDEDAGDDAPPAAGPAEDEPADDELVEEGGEYALAAADGPVEPHEHLTEDLLAHQFLAAHPRLLFNANRGGWMAYADGVWRADTTAHVATLLKAWLRRHLKRLID